MSGRSSAGRKKNKQTRKKEAADTRERIPVEGKFGNCKREYGLDRIYTRKMDASEC